MIESLLRLPYVGYWLPVLVATVVAVPVFWLFGRSRPPVTAPAGDALAGVGPPEPNPEDGSRSGEQRRSFRRGGNPIGLLYAPTLPQREAPLRASLIDRSIGGLCLLTGEAVTVGSVLSVRPTSADEMVPWVEIEVCVCRPCEDGFEVGCRFVKTPPYSIMLLFG